MDKVSCLKTSEARRGHWDWFSLVCLESDGWNYWRSVKFWRNISDEIMDGGIEQAKI
jgi:hypothetical protein